MTSVNSVFGMSMDQIARLFGALPTRHGKHDGKSQFKSKNTAQTASAFTEAGKNETGKNETGKSGGLAEEALRAIQSLTPGGIASPSATPPSPAGACAHRFKSAIGGDDIELSQTTSFEGAIKEASYSFSFSVSQSLDSTTGALQHTDYTFQLAINDRLVLSGWATGGRGENVEALQMSLSFSYSEASASATRTGNSSVQEAAFRAVTGQINIDAGFLQQRLPLSFGDNSRRQQLQVVAPNPNTPNPNTPSLNPPSPNVQISSNVLMASGRYESASLWTADGGGAFSRATETSETFQFGLQLAWSR